MAELVAIYLRDHHAGATAGLELARRAARANRGNSYGEELASLAAEIEEDLRTLERIMEDLGVGPDWIKDRVAWTGERLARLKRNGTWVSYSPLSRVVELEALVIGVTGKLALWEALRAALGEAPGGVALDSMEERARDQRGRLDSLRRRAAREAFSTA
jgi:hypothetical protein